MGYIAILITIALAAAIWFYHPTNPTGAQSDTSIGARSIENTVELQKAASAHDAQIEDALHE